MELTKDEAVRLHRELWDWLSKNPKKIKYDWPRWAEPKLRHTKSHCFCCEYDSQYKPETIKEAMKVCSHCCLVWGDESESGVGIIHCLESVFAEWLQCEDNLAERTKLAEQIRDLPVREDA